MRTFLYGTLLDDTLRARLLGRAVAGVDAQLRGYRVVSHADEPIPALVADASSTASGILLDVLSEDELQRMDAYEFAFDYAVTTVTVDVAGTATDARVYVPGDNCVLSDATWSFDKWLTEKGPLSRERAIEIGAARPPLDAETLRKQWKMIGSRAAARLRAAEEEPPSDLRYTAHPGDAIAQNKAPLRGDFFKFSQFEMVHRTFHNTTTDPLPREAIIGVDAAIVLPYDPVSDCVLLVEQVRSGPLMRGAPNPWALEPVAGMVDPGETPEDAAIRETAEEADISNFTLRKMFGCYPSPGGSTDYFYCYLALGTLPEPTSYTGGMPEENEDLRIHVIPFSDAMRLVETGEANIAPLIAMLLWLQRERDTLRRTA